jgi:large subunit ribosomal protein L29
MKMSEIKQRSKKELREVLAEKREKLRELRFELAAGKVKNVREIRIIKKDIARILTFLSEINSDRKSEIQDKKR